eukprot:Gregarina_sp_Pseudo_9__2157@NODE_2507_length_975_cov_525_277778_g2303_i0_p1_GENE_NODE_2507_length_975_cov_525_277778_g2303_i0NODE_2507_length_975_cov_525_277778_g2303_i0_p1_ORF_typecomplete_len195_score33_99_NODE_2507_length_975_cov_525_277778_g2303_i0268852
MRFLSCLIPCVLSASAISYVWWNNEETNPPECYECAALPDQGSIPDVMNNCMLKVPRYCEYNVVAANVFQVTTLCPSTLGFSFADFTTTLRSAHIAEMDGTVEMQLENVTSTCELTYHLSDTENCVASPTGPGATLTATNGLLELDLTTLQTPIKFINFEASGPECGTKFIRATFDAMALIQFRGMKEDAPVTP